MLQLGVPLNLELDGGNGLNSIFILCCLNKLTQDLHDPGTVSVSCGLDCKFSI